MLEAKPIAQIIGSNISKARKANGLTQVRLAQCVGMDRTTITKIERGAKTPSIGSLLKIASALGTSPAVLFDGWENTVY